jgi:hypothetical protein
MNMYDVTYHRRRHAEALSGRPKWIAPAEQLTFSKFDGAQKRLSDYVASSD